MQIVDRDAFRDGGSRQPGPHALARLLAVRGGKAVRRSAHSFIAFGRVPVECKRRRFRTGGRLWLAQLPEKASIAS